MNTGYEMKKNELYGYKILFERWKGGKSNFIVAMGFPAKASAEAIKTRSLNRAL